MLWSSILFFTFIDKIEIVDNRCSWEIFEVGSCKINLRSRECFFVEYNTYRKEVNLWNRIIVSSFDI